MSGETKSELNSQLMPDDGYLEKIMSIDLDNDDDNESDDQKEQRQVLKEQLAQGKRMAKKQAKKDYDVALAKLKKEHLLETHVSDAKFAKGKAELKVKFEVAKTTADQWERDQLQWTKHTKIKASDMKLPAAAATEARHKRQREEAAEAARVAIEGPRRVVPRTAAVIAASSIAALAQANNRDLEDGKREAVASDDDEDYDEDEEKADEKSVGSSALNALVVTSPRASSSSASSSAADKPQNDCMICHVSLSSGDVQMGMCGHLLHVKCFEQWCTEEEKKGNMHIKCGVCCCLFYIDSSAANQGLTVHREPTYDILYKGKRVEKRSTKWRKLKYVWLRSGKETSTAACPPGSIMALMMLDQPVTSIELLPKEQATAWCKEPAKYYFPIVEVWPLSKPFAHDISSQQTLFKVTPTLAAQLVELIGLPARVPSQVPAQVVVSQPTIEDVRKWLSRTDHKVTNILEDSLHVESVCPVSFDMVSDEVKWIPRESMRNRSNQALSRDKAYYHTLVGGRMPYYGGYPGATAGHATSTELTAANHPTIHAMYQHLRKVDPAINHLIATRYRDQHDCIAAHSDKTPDLVPNSLIYDVSFGATRHMVFKKDKTIAHTLEMKHGSLFILGPRTNALYTHEIVQESVPCPARISLIYRTAATTLSPAQHAALRRKYDDQLAAQINNPPATRK